jgi:hypothetical protein
MEARERTSIFQIGEMISILGRSEIRSMTNFLLTMEAKGCAVQPHS